MTKTPRDYQTAGVSSFMENVDRGIMANLLVMATGLGKTFTADLIQSEFRKKYGGKCLFLVDQIELAHQARASLSNNNPNDIITIEMGQLHAHTKSDIVVGCVASLGKLDSTRISKFNPDDFSIIICDEGHKSISEIWQNVLRYMGVHPDNFKPGKALLGLTATPNRTDNQGLELLYDDIIGEYDIRYGVENGWLTDMHYFNINPKDDQAQKIKDCYEMYIRYVKNENMLVYCEDVKEAYIVAEYFKSKGISAECIEANTEETLRSTYISEYKKGNLKILTNYGTLTTGFDAPVTKAIAIMRKISSSLTYTQVIGRGVRPDTSAMVDFFDTPEERRLSIEHSMKDSCMVFDFLDLNESTQIQNVFTLFGLRKDFKHNSVKPVFKEVVEPVLEMQKSKSLNIQAIDSLEDAELLYKTTKIKLKRDKDSDITEHSAFFWFQLDAYKYQCPFDLDKKALIIEKDLLNRFNVIEYDNRTGKWVKLNSFSSLAGAVNIADKYAKQTFNTALADKEAKWRTDIPTQAQLNLIKRLYGWQRKKLREVQECYDGTNIRMLTYDGQTLFRGDAHKLLAKKFNS